MGGESQVRMGNGEWGMGNGFSVLIILFPFPPSTFRLPPFLRSTSGFRRPTLRSLHRDNQFSSIYAVPFKSLLNYTFEQSTISRLFGAHMWS